MKKLFALLLILALSLASVVSVYAEPMDIKSVDTILAEIRADQGIDATKQIDLTKVNKAMLEELGDSVMEAMIGNNAVHEKMDVRLGGDGSESLTTFHTRMGYNYLASLQNTANGPNSGFRFGRMMGAYGFNTMMGLTGWNGMMNGYAFGGMMGAYGLNNNDSSYNGIGNCLKDGSLNRDLNDETTTPGWNGMMRSNNWGGMMN
jgi:hypothetical protein